jgi:hypothetical protein
VIEKSKVNFSKGNFIMKLHEEFKLYEHMWDAQPNLKHKRIHSVKLAEKLDMAELANRGDRSQAIVGDDPYNGDMLYLKDLNELAEYATYMFCAYNEDTNIDPNPDLEPDPDIDVDDHTPSSFRVEVLENSQVKMSPWVRKALEDAINTTGFTLLRDGKIGDPSAHMQIKNIMKTLHYDNGKPLSCKEYDYFDHYDRDQDFWGFYEDELIYDFITDGKDLYVRIDMSFDELRDQLRYTYDGASWDHDFDESFKPYKLTEASSNSKKAYRALMDLQGYIDVMPGWKIIDCEQTSDDTMMLKCDLADGTFVWYELDNGEYEYTEDVEDLVEYAQQRQVAVDIVDNDSSFNNYYDVRVYLHYRPTWMED